MTKLVPTKPKVIIKALEKKGFKRVRTTGSHVRLIHPKGQKVSVSLHNYPLPKGTLKSILRQAQISFEELKKYF